MWSVSTLLGLSQERAGGGDARSVAQEDLWGTRRASQPCPSFRGTPSAPIQPLLTPEEAGSGLGGSSDDQLNLSETLLWCRHLHIESGVELDGRPGTIHFRRWIGTYPVGLASAGRRMEPGIGLGDSLPRSFRL